MTETTPVPEEATTAPTPETEIAALKEALAEAEARANASKDAHLRALAELENARKRADREITAGLKFGAERLLNELLGVSDSLELGLKAASAPEAQIRGLVEGMELTRKQLLSVLEKQGVTQVDPIGQPFNPDFHEAVTMLASAAAAPNHVLDVLQKGYKLHERLLRPAMVVVAKAP